MNIPEVENPMIQMVPKALLLKDLNHNKKVDMFAKPSEKYTKLFKNPFVLLVTEFGQTFFFPVVSSDSQAPSKFCFSSLLLSKSSLF